MCRVLALFPPLSDQCVYDLEPRLGLLNNCLDTLYIPPEQLHFKLPISNESAK